MENHIDTVIGMFPRVMENHIDTVIGMFPHVSRNKVQRDLNRTQNLEQTINHILDGTLMEDSDEDSLPDLTTFTSVAQSTSNTATFLRPSHENDCNKEEGSGMVRHKAKVHTMSDSDDCTDYGLLPGPTKSKDDSPRTALHNEHDKTSCISSRYKKCESIDLCIALDDDSNTRTTIDLNQSPPLSPSSDGLPDLASRIQSFGAVRNFGECLTKDGNVDDAFSNSTSSSQTCTNVIDDDISRNRCDSERATHSFVPNNDNADIKGRNQESKSKGKTTAVKRDKELEKLKKQLEKEAKKREQEEKKREAEREKQKKRLLADSQKAAKPGECLKFISVAIDLSIMNEGPGPAIVTQLQGQGIRYEVAEQPTTGVMTFWREVTEVVDGEDGKLKTETKEVCEDHVIMYTKSQDFASMVLANQQESADLSLNDVSLRRWVSDTKARLEDRNITIIVQGMEQYFRSQKAVNQRAYRQKVTGVQPKRHKKSDDDDFTVSRVDVEEALIDIQLHTDCNVRFCENNLDVAKCVLSYTKAVAEAPFKRSRLTTGFTFHIDSGGSTKVDKDGHGLQRVWRQQVTQLKNVTAEVANAILAVHPSPVSLYQAYNRCQSSQEAELLLADIEVRRGVGVMATTRRVGKEMSRRMYQLMTANDGDIVIH